MKDVFGRSLLKLYKEHNDNQFVAAKSKEDAVRILLTNTNYYATIGSINLTVVSGCGYAGTEGKLL